MGGGVREEWVGEWMAQKGIRDETVLATKYTTPQHVMEKGRIQANFGGNSAKSMKLAVDESLKRLQTSYIDLYYVHWCESIDFMDHWLA